MEKIITLQPDSLRSCLHISTNVRTCFHQRTLDMIYVCIYAWKATFHFTLSFWNQFSYDVTACVSFIHSVVIWHVDDTFSYYFIFSASVSLYLSLFFFSFSFSLSFTGLTCSLHFHSWAHTPQPIWIFKLTWVPLHSCGMREPITILNNDVMLSLKLKRCICVRMIFWFWKAYALNINLICSCKRGRKFHRIRLNETRL